MNRMPKNCETPLNVPAHVWWEYWKEWRERNRKILKELIIENLPNLMKTSNLYINEF